jgi:hypothetical protein
LVELPEIGHSRVTENLCLQEYGGIGLFSFESITPSFDYSSLYFSGLLGMARDAIHVTALVAEDNLKRAGDELLPPPRATP